MKKVLLAVVIVLFLVVLFAAWLWKLGAPPTLAASTARLEDVQGQVETRGSSTATWTAVQEGQPLTAGTQIRTGETGSVTLTVSGVSQTRLASSTELSIDTLILPQGDNLKSQTGLTLVTGRTWSRIVRLLELDSSYTIKTDDVVATVRGTTFETGRSPQGESWLAVYEGTVSAKDHTITKALPKGTGMRANRGAMQFVSSTSAMTQNGAWLQKNLEADAAFLKETQKAVRDELTKDRQGKMFQMFGPPAERLHMAMANEQEKLELADKYLSRQMAWAKQLEDEGHIDKAKAELERMKAEMTAWQQQASLNEKEKLFRQAMVQGSILFHNAPIEPITDAIKDIPKELSPQLLPDLRLDPKIDLKLDPPPILKAPLQDLKATLDTSPTMQPMQPIKEGPATAPTRELDPKLEIEKSILDARTTTLVPTQLVLSSSVSALRFKTSAPLSVVIVYSDGRRIDGTGQTTFVSSDPAIALLNGNILQANDLPGRVQVTASYRENGVSVTDSLIMSIQP